MKVGNPSIKSTKQMKTQVDTTQRKKQPSNQQKIRKQSYANRTHGYKMPINNNKEDLKQESCHLPQIN